MKRLLTHAVPFVAVLLLLTLVLAARADDTVDPSTIPLEKYVSISPDGHLSLEGERARFWAWIGHFHLEGGLTKYKLEKDDTPEIRKQKTKKTYEVYDAFAQRIADLGFNCARMWNYPDYDADYEPGDGSQSDLFAFTLNALNKRGVKVWITSFGQVGPMGPEDVDIIDDPSTAEAWKDAVANSKSRFGKAYGWDKRMLAISIRRMKKIADWRNKYKGNIRLGDDPQVAVWEFTNEEWWMKWMVNGHWQNIPQFFQDDLRGQWCDFLKVKYGSDKGLQKAWRFLLPGESLKNKAVAIAPLASSADLSGLSDANPAAIAAMKVADHSYSREEFVAQRGRDVLEFFLSLHVNYKVKQREAARKMGRGLARIPILFDTGDHLRIHTLYLHMFADAVAKCTYSWQFAEDEQNPRFPWISGLDEYPRTHQGWAPWAEAGRIPGKPFFLYETQVNNPSKYRCEYPYRLLALAAIQDMDIVAWHLFGRPNDPAEENPYSKRINYSHKGGGVEGVHYKNDEVYASAMRAAGKMFINGALKPVENPTLMTFGKKSLLDPVSMDNHRSYGDLRRLINGTVYRHGLSMLVDTSLQEDKVEGRTLERGYFEPNPNRPTSQIAFDRQKANLIIDAPSAVAYTGFFADHGGPVTFSNGVTMDNVVIKNDDKIAYPMGEDEKHVSLAITAEDGLPLDKSKTVMVSLVSTSFNTGFELNHDNVAKGNPYDAMTTGKRIEGEPPVQYARVGATLKVPMLNGMTYEYKDWHFRTIAKGTVKKGTLKVPASEPVFYIALRR